MIDACIADGDMVLMEPIRTHTLKMEQLLVHWFRGWGLL